MPDPNVIANAVSESTQFFEIEKSYYVLCGIGAFVLFFKLQKKGRPVFEVIGHIFPEWSSSPCCRVLEAAIFVFLGAIIGTLIAQPGNPQQAIAAGLGWTGLLSKTSG